jgi:hypothetical protein
MAAGVSLDLGINTDTSKPFDEPLALTALVQALNLNADTRRPLSQPLTSPRSQSVVLC